MRKGFSLDRPNGRWRPTFGALPDDGGARFSLWAPRAQQVEVIVERSCEVLAPRTLTRFAEGMFGTWYPGVQAGDRYRYRLDGEGPYPDPASRFQPEGVHGPSEVVDPRRFDWTDGQWRGIALENLILYELHVGTFSPEGTFVGAIERLPDLADLGITAIELMPVADFPGTRNWGYDSAALYAPARCYGRPDDLRRLVDAAHRLDLAVFLDVVYNHLGPDGAYVALFAPDLFSERHRSPWGRAINLDGPGSATVRQFLIENALHWVHEYHIDGLRLDATHALVDESREHFVADLAARVHESREDRRILVIAEDHRNLANLVKPREKVGWDLDAVWADDFHHQLRRLLAGDSDGYYGDFSGTVADVATTVGRGWFFCGQRSAYLGQPRGTDPSGIPFSKFVVCLQNHDQIGNRPFGKRLHHQIDLAAYRAASVLLLISPETPLLFMGQEWAATSRFYYFTDHEKTLGALITEGRRREFSRFAAFADPETRKRIPDPQDEATFTASCLNWAERDHEPHASTFRLYRQLLKLRRTEPALCGRDAVTCEVIAHDEDTLVVVRKSTDGSALLAVVRLRGSGLVDLRACPFASGRHWQTVLTSEDAAFSPTAAPPAIDVSGVAPVIDFVRPSAIVMRSAPEAR